MSKPLTECDWTSKSLELHNLITKKSNQTILILWIAKNENRKYYLCDRLVPPSCWCLCTQPQLFMLLPSYHHFIFSYSHTKLYLIHFIYHSPRHSFHLPYSISLIPSTIVYSIDLLIIVYHFHIYHIWSYLCYVVIQSYFYDRLRNTILLKYAHSWVHSWADTNTYAPKSNFSSIKSSIQLK